MKESALRLTMICSKYFETWPSYLVAKTESKEKCEKQGDDCIEPSLTGTVWMHLMEYET
jgi:hypothetical protein